ncbi:MAG: hypothetical protein QXD84_08690 [Thermoplasmata archaeon]
MSERGKMGKREAELAREGWVRRSTYDEPRLSEMVEMYRELGLEVRLEEPEAEELCEACLRGAKGSLKTIYTREPRAGENRPEERGG